MSKLYQTVYIERGAQIIVTAINGKKVYKADVLGNKIHSGDIVVSITGNLRELESSFGLYQIVGKRELKNYNALRAISIDDVNKDIFDRQEYDLKGSLCVIHKKYNEHGI